MSDVEDYAYWPYDDLEDVLYDADPDPELADDLASHAIHSPIYHEEDAVKDELQEYFSDWEYYSDDYVDDDPTLLRKDPQDGGPIQRFANIKREPKRGKKRKLVETQDIPPFDLNEDQLLIRCIKGVVWAKPSELRTPQYEGGQENKVALLKDWKEVFAVTDSGWGRASERARQDESWANDLSLADMGLRNVPRQASFKQDDQEEEAGFEEDDAEDDGAEHSPVGIEEDVLSDKDSPGPRSSKLRTTMLLDEDDRSITQGLPAAEDLEDERGPRKRRRVKPDLPSPPDSNEAVTLDLEEPQAMSNIQAAALAKEDSFAGGSDETVQAKAPISVGPDVPQSRKRKAAEEPEDGVTRSTASSRAKRVASSVSNVPTSSRPKRSTKTR
ncbi:hypothetical protein A1O7_02807 [Cladophialophora yegresii CBS 114405]|uniref:Uncharacterized protein n=1 Tax=Cladophialophora yegresii CBS 114405 TaxID=1182544 RepID=W9W365_9EURO|nr:uncharacterized protein A1O7_02807 [Cladophialophora yegresii CBS 114405]EXJ62373.1 hypothetical protein A1O7_02807 [Cladophialophora yegresii CBS 114405]